MMLQACRSTASGFFTPSLSSFRLYFSSHCFCTLKTGGMTIARYSSIRFRRDRGQTNDDAARPYPPRQREARLAQAPLGSDSGTAGRHRRSDDGVRGGHAREYSRLYDLPYGLPVPGVYHRDAVRCILLFWLNPFIGRSDAFW